MPRPNLHEIFYMAEPKKKRTTAKEAGFGEAVARYVYLCKIFSTWLNQNRKVKLREVWWGRVWAQTVWGRSANCCWWRIQVNLCHVELLSSCLEDKLERLNPSPLKRPNFKPLVVFSTQIFSPKKRSFNTMGPWLTGPYCYLPKIICVTWLRDGSG